MKVRAENLAANAGEDAALEGRPRSSNPYPPESVLYTWWDAGWLSGSEEDAELKEEYPDE